MRRSGGRGPQESDTCAELEPPPSRPCPSPCLWAVPGGGYGLSGHSRAGATSGGARQPRGGRRHHGSQHGGVPKLERADVGHSRPKVRDALRAAGATVSGATGPQEDDIEDGDGGTGPARPHGGHPDGGRAGGRVRDASGRTGVE